MHVSVGIQTSSPCCLVLKTSNVSKRHKRITLALVGLSTVKKAAFAGKFFTPDLRHISIIFSSSMVRREDADRWTGCETDYQKAGCGCGRRRFHLWSFLARRLCCLACTGGCNGRRYASRRTQMPAHYAKAELAERGAIARFKDGKSR